jgi:hypothetical protein
MGVVVQLFKPDPRRPVHGICQARRLSADYCNRAKTTGEAHVSWPRSNDRRMDSFLGPGSLIPVRPPISLADEAWKVSQLGKIQYPVVSVSTDSLDRKHCTIMSEY